MPIEPPVLDDLRYEQLFEVLRSRIPIHTPEWTDHNDSDPGITLMQLFAFLGEQIGYRLNRVPDKNYVEFLKLIGVTLRPAEAARTTLALLLSSPATAMAFAVPRGSAARAATGEDPPAFETTAEIIGVPAQLAALATTLHGDLRDLAATDSGGRDPLISPADPDAYLDAHYELPWDGKKPKLVAMPGEPVPLFAQLGSTGHRYLWIGLAFNPARPAGFLGQRVTLTVQLDDDELPSSEAVAACRDERAVAVADTSGARYGFYRPARSTEPRGTWQPLRPLSDTTHGFSRSGALRFDVPMDMGAIPDGEWVDVREEATRTTEEICADATSSPDAPGVLPPVPHPLVGGIRVPVPGTPTLVPISGWLRVKLAGSAPSISVRAITFNATTAVNAVSAGPEILARGDGSPGQRVSVGNENVLADSLQLAVEDLDAGQLRQWREVESFDAAGPVDIVYTLDRESGAIDFGDGVRGLPPAPGARIVALSYMHGGGLGGDVPVATITQAVSMPAEVQAVTNIVDARGGRGAETLDDAKQRAPQALKTLERAVTLDDHEFLTGQSPGVRVARARAIALRLPRPSDRGPGLDMTREVPGAIAVVIVPDRPGLYPTPTAGELRAVCRHLNEFRLITTELAIVPPQYVRIFDLDLSLRALPGHSVAELRESIAALLEERFHVLRGGGGDGYGFAITVHHADLVAAVLRTPGVDRVETLTARFDGRAPAEPGEPPPMIWRPERWAPAVLTNCPDAPGEVDRIELADDEAIFVDTSTTLVRIIG